MSFFSIYKFLLAIVICAIAVLGADARHVDKRWIQYTGVGGSDDVLIKLYIKIGNQM